MPECLTTIAFRSSCTSLDVAKVFTCLIDFLFFYYTLVLSYSLCLLVFVIIIFVFTVKILGDWLLTENSLLLNIYLLCNMGTNTDTDTGHRNFKKIDTDMGTAGTR